MTASSSSRQRPIAAWFYLGSALSSSLGNSVANIVWPWLVLQRTGDPAAAGLVATIIFIPSIVFALVGGHLIDSIGRKPMSIISDTISAASVVGLILVDWYLGLNLWWFIIIGIIGAVGDIPGAAARNALVGEVSATSGKSLDWLAGVNQGLMGISFFIGPAAAGILLTVLPVSSILWITAGCSGLAAVLTMLIRLNAVPNTDGSQENVFQGWRAWLTIIADAPIRLLAISGGIAQILVMPYLMVLLPAHFESIDAPASMGFAFSAYAVGMVIGGVCIARIGTVRRRFLWTISMVLYTISFVLMAWLHNSYAVIAGMAIAGLGGGFQGPLITVLVTEYVVESLRGRAFSLFTAISLFAAPIGLSITTVALGFVDIYAVAIGCAILWAIAAVWFIAEGMRVIADPDRISETVSEH